MDQRRDGDIRKSMNLVISQFLRESTDYDLDGG